MPYEGLKKYITYDDRAQGSITLASIISTEQYYSVSRSALLIRLKTKGLISNKAFLEFIQIPVQESAKQYGYDTALYKKGNVGLVIGDFGEKARDLFEKGIISEGHYLELLHKITPQDED